MRVGDIDIFLLGAGRPARGVRPSALKHINLATCALDWQQSAFRDAIGNPDIHFLGGYQVQAVIEKYPQLNFTVVADWAGKSILHTLLAAPFGECPAMISYSDTVFRPQVIEKMLNVTADVVVCIDTRWRQRYADRTIEDLRSAETIDLAEHSSKNLKTDPRKSTVEFTGLMLLRQSALARLEKVDESAIGSNLLDAMNFFIAQGLLVEFVDADGEWAEFNAPADIARFVLGTKADTLARLEGVVTKSEVGRQVVFSVAEWLRGEVQVLDRIAATFPATQLVIRSSARSEDSWDASLAGSHESVLDVPSGNLTALKSAINNVIDSYTRQGSDDQVLVQEQLSDVTCSGVVFTRTLETGGPYYRINFDDETQSTESVTSGVGRSLRTVFVSRRNPARVAAIDAKLDGLMHAILELEELLGYDKLDIEFALDAENKAHIFQVRPITVDHSDFEAEDEEIFASLQADCDRFAALQSCNPFTAGERTVFGVMPDWNPAEIIGTRPSPLAYSLYRFLISDSVWAEQRAEFGYRDVRPHNLIVAFSGQPYVDIRASLNSFVPASVPAATAERLVDVYIDRLIENPDLHDKLEFEVAFTVLSPCFKSNVELRLPTASAQDQQDIALLEDGLRHITQQALSRLADDIEPVYELERRCDEISATSMSDLHKAITLLEDCRHLGTLAFAHAARAGFVATTFLNDFVTLGVLTEAQRQQFLASVNTVTAEFESDLVRLNGDKLSLQAFVDRYGHLRPGTYDITVPSYREDPKRYLIGGEDLQVPYASEPFVADAKLREQVATLLADIKIDIAPDALFDYMRAAIRAREEVKFIFSRNLSLALDCLVRFGEARHIERQDLANLTLDDYRNTLNGSTGQPELLELIAQNQRVSCVTQMIELPELITAQNDLYCFEQRRSKPNFVTAQAIEARCLHLQTGAKDDLKGKIVFIPQADPGYDWIFVHGIAGLVTQYGGANSHMAIRSAELGVPAAIGVGDRLYESLLHCRRIRLDCNARTIEVTA